MRVLMGMPSKGSLGGPNACEPPFVAELRKAGVAVEEEVYVYGERFRKTDLRHRVTTVLQTARTLRKRLRAEGFDVLHLNTAFDVKALLRDAVTVHLLRPGPGKIFLKFHGSDARLVRTNNPMLRLLGRVLLSRVDAVGVLSNEEKENFVRAGVAERKIFVVKNVVAQRAAHPDPGFAGRMNIREGVPVLLFIARFVPAKGLVDVIRACAIVRDREVDFVLLCVGDGPTRPAAEAEVARLNLEAKVRFVGYIPEAETDEFYAGSTMLVFPTYFQEGFPMVVFRSVAAGIPVVTTRIRAAADYLREPDNCLWVEAKNPQMLAEKIIGLLCHPEVRGAMGRNNRELARQFTAARVAEEYLAIYDQLIAREKVY